jgi:hypothetical protein
MIGLLEFSKKSKVDILHSRPFSNKKLSAGGGGGATSTKATSTTELPL